MQLSPVSIRGRNRDSYFHELFTGNIGQDGFVALGVAGDAFLYRRTGNAKTGQPLNDHLILVDGGGSGQTLRNELTAHAGSQKYLDIVVCTHGDSDHSKGLATFLDKKWGYRPGCGPSGRGAVGEFWLPGRWVGVIRAFIDDPEPFIDGLMAEFDDLRKNRPNWQDLTAQQLEELVTKQAVQALSDPRVASGSDDGVRIPEEVELRSWARKRGKATRLLNDARSRIRHHNARRKIGDGFRDYWLAIIDTVDEIRLIGYQAVRHRSRIRWFDYDEFMQRGRAEGGKSGVLVPVNAVESIPRAFPVGVLERVQLTRINRQSLAFYAPEDNNHLGVLFCGDSPMGSGAGYATSFPMPPPPRNGILATAPHHGSSSNNIAYTHIHAWKPAPHVKWVRSGGEPQHPDGAFKSFPAAERSCTNCSRAPKSIATTAIGFIQITGTSPSWVQLSPKHDCDCV